MNHRRYQELLAVYRDLAGDERAEVDAHLRQCPECTALLRSYEAMDRDLLRLEDPRPDSRLRQAFQAAVAQERQAGGHRSWLRRRAGLLAEAAIVVLLSLGGWLVIRGGVQQDPGRLSTAADPRAATTIQPTQPTINLSTPGPGVASILADPPPPGETVEVDAYYSGTDPWIRRGGPAPRPGSNEALCPINWQAALTDQPFQGLLTILNGSRSNALPDDAPWLIAVTPEQTQLPYHARLRGHLGDPAFAHCPNADRIFVVEEVVAVYEEEAPPAPSYLLPEGYASWPRYHDIGLGYSLAHPPEWDAAEVADVALALYPPEWPDHIVFVRVYNGETHYDPYEPAAVPALLQGDSLGVYEQGLFLAGDISGGQRLAGYRVDRGGQGGERTVSVLFSAHGRTYELSLRYPAGFAVQQPVLTAYSLMVEGFRLETDPNPSPTPPVRQTLGEGPFLSEEEVMAQVRQRQGDDTELLEAELVSEAEARRWAEACSTFPGHPEGVWMLTVRGRFEGQTRTMRLFLDAVTGEHLCGKEIATAGQGVFAIYPGKTPEGEPLLTVKDIVAYDPQTHEIQLTPAAAERIFQLNPPVSGQPFVVAVGGEAIYDGAFWTNLSSLSYDGVIIETLAARNGTIRLQLGYPSSGFFKGEDPRSDPRVLQALEQAGKLQSGVPVATATPVR